MTATGLYLDTILNKPLSSLPDLVEGTFTPISADLVIYYLQFIIDYCTAVSTASVANSSFLPCIQHQLTLYAIRGTHKACPEPGRRERRLTEIYLEFAGPFVLMFV